MKYSEYFEIDKNYYPEINPDSVKNPGNEWQYTYPHETFVELLSSVELMLSRENTELRKGIWIEGSYGTGKSRVVWALKNLLECSEKEFRDYFEKNHDEFKKVPDLEDKLFAQRSGKIVTVFRYNSGEITTIKKFITAVFDSVSDALDNAGIAYNGNKTLRGKVVQWLSDDANKAYFNAIISMPQYRSLGSLSGKNADDIIAQLNNPSASSDALLTDILRIGEEKGIKPFNIEMQDLKDWLTDIIESNQLKAIVFLWDEFSSFFKNNPTALDVFQSLAELANDKPFYMVIVTHMAGSFFSDSDKRTKDAFNIVYDRFAHKTIEMPDNIAFRLIKHAMKIKDVAKDEYEDFADELTSYMPFSRKAVCEAVKVDDDVMKGIFPIHPMAALLLKHFAKNFASNQRSMFNFIKNSQSNDLHAFQWFIENHSPEDNEILTIDYLWDFFYEKGGDENSDTQGKSNLDIAIATILDTYPSNAAKLNREEQRVLKTVLMMQAISKKMNNGVELLRPTVQNLGLAFEGDDSMENNRAINIARNQLVQKKILYIDTNGSVEEFAASAIAGDQVQIDAIKDRLRKETKTAKLIDDGDLMSAFTFNSALRARYNFQYATVDNFKVTVNRINNMPKSYKFNAVICIARTEEEQTTLRLKIAEAVRDSAYADIIFIDATSNIMGADRFEQWISVAAQTEYWRPKDPRLADNKQTDVKRTLADWKNDITGGKFTVYFGTDFKENASSMTLLKEKLAAVVLKVYPLSFDNCNVSDQFFTDAKYADAAKKGIAMAKTVDFTRPGIFQEKYVKAMLGDALGIEHFEEVKPHLSISKLKLKVKTLIDGVFEKDVRIAISDIFDYLMKEGFMPCSMYAYLAGFLLSDYSDEPYRYGVGSAGDDGGKMTAEELGNDIGEYVKNKVSPIKNYKEKYIEIMTPDQKAFVDFAAKAFGIAENLSVEQAASKVRIKLRDIGYPIWCFKAIDTNSLEGFIDKLAEISNSQNGGNVPTLAGQMGKMLLAVPSSIDNLAQLLTSENGYKAMGEFLHDFEEGQLLTCAEAIGIPDVMADVKKQIGSGEATWLWNMDTGLEELRKLLVDYKIILQSTQLGIKSASFFSCMQAWKEYTRYIKSPASVITAKCPELMYFIGCLKDIAENGEISHEKHEKFLAELTEKASIISALKEEKIAIFKETYSLYLVGFNDAEVRKVYNTLPASSFTDDKSTFEKNVSAISDEIRSEQERFRLLELWEEKTGTRNAYEWSEKNRTPIKAMVSVDEQVNAFKLFDAINYPNTEASKVSDALSYLKSNPGFIASLTDKSKIDTAFIRVIVKKYYAILTDLDAVRDHLEKVIPKAPYSWYGDPAVSTEIEKLANSKYRTGGNSVVMQRIDKMDAEEAKKYLRKLVQEDVEVGISIISKEGI